MPLNEVKEKSEKVGLKLTIQKNKIMASGPIPSWHQFSTVQSLGYVQLSATPWTAAHQASMSITNSQSLLMSIELMMPSNHLILCRPLLFLPSVFLNMRVFSSELALHIKSPKY